MTQKNKKSAGDGASQNILYVVLHGLITLVDVGEEGFIAFLLNMGKEHKYLVGDWLAEAEIPKRKYWKKPLRAALENVDEGQICSKNVLDPDKNAIAKKYELPDGMHPRVRAIFDLPRPDNIQHFTIRDLVKGTLQDNDNELIQLPNHLAGVRIFTYTFPNASNPDSPRLIESNQSLLWRCPDELATVNGDSIAVLHIYNQPGVALPVGSPHNREEFNNSASFLGTHVTQVNDTTKKGDEDPLPAGILDGEVECLYNRGVFAVHYINEIRSEDDLGRQAGGCGSELCAACDAVVIHGFNEQFYLKTKKGK